MSRSCFASFPVCVYKFSSHYLNNIIFIDNSLGPLARDSPCIFRSFIIICITNIQNIHWTKCLCVHSLQSCFIKWLNDLCLLLHYIYRLSANYSMIIYQRPTHRVVLAVETFEMRKRLLYLPVPKPSYNAEAILKICAICLSRPIHFVKMSYNSKNHSLDCKLHYL